MQGLGPRAFYLSRVGCGSPARRCFTSAPPHPALRATFPPVGGRLYGGIYRPLLRGAAVRTRADGGHRGRSPLYQKRVGGRDFNSHVPHLYPYPHTVFTYTGFWGLFPTERSPVGALLFLISSGEMNSPCGNSLPLSSIEFTACRPPRLRGGTTPDHPLHVPHLYPYPHTVFTYTGFWGLSSILMRRRRMFTSTIFSSP